MRAITMVDNIHVVVSRLFVCWLLLTMGPFMTTVSDCHEGTVGETTNKREAVTSATVS